ncbi:hypothetical protein [Curtobacterium sp. MCPF17_051]|uniref:hypothetical protein n=1 Tax=Curtobacterium sp. MCPF17_051 TaxID=2175640 RepID=UPI000DA87D8A|nr:hypothetical protein [Curtobacterium sp. MCPF17_051]PZF28213.1 hypothetical protein DEJ35_12710 [Curtobacterium sp. MCPF17_051]
MLLHMARLVRGHSAATAPLASALSDLAEALVQARALASASASASASQFGLPCDEGVCDPSTMGTHAWINWNAHAAGDVELERMEDDLYSDRYFVGVPTQHGPYSLSTVVGFEQESAASVRLALKLMSGAHADLAPRLVVDGELAPSDSKSYHGGTPSDEIAALAALTLGVRLRAAGTSRLSGFHEPGTVRPPILLEVPALATPGRPGKEFIPATMSRAADLSLLERLLSFPRIGEEDQVELVRAARAYASGLWWSNEDPNQSWLYLVTAVEIAANHRQKISASPEELIESLWPELWTVLAPVEPARRAKVAKLMASQVRATKKFVDFLAECAPLPPSVRPVHGSLEWGEMRQHARRVYAYRSDALHGGKPFPLPMLDEPRIELNDAVQEVPYGLSTSGLGGSWMADEAPMLLATFEHIARGALFRWWDELKLQH